MELLHNNKYLEIADAMQSYCWNAASDYDLAIQLEKDMHRFLEMISVNRDVIAQRHLDSIPDQLHAATLLDELDANYYIIPKTDED